MTGQGMPEGAYVQAMLSVIGICECVRRELDLERMLEFARRQADLGMVPPGVKLSPEMLANQKAEAAVALEMLMRLEDLIEAHGRWTEANTKSTKQLVLENGMLGAQAIQAAAKARAKSMIRDDLGRDPLDGGRVN